MGPDHRVDGVSARDAAAGDLGTWVAQVLWEPPSVGGPWPGDLDELLVRVTFPEGRVHLVNTELDEGVSAPWCPPEQLEAGLVVEMRNARGDFVARDPEEGRPTAFVGPGPRGLPGEGAGGLRRLAVSEWPTRWEPLSVPRSDDREFERFEVDPIQPSEFGGLTSRHHDLGTLEVYAIESSDLLGGESSGRAVLEGGVVVHLERLE